MGILQETWEHLNRPEILKQAILDTMGGERFKAVVEIVDYDLAEDNWFLKNGVNAKYTKNLIAFINKNDRTMTVSKNRFGHTGIFSCEDSINDILNQLFLKRSGRTS